MGQHGFGTGNGSKGPKVKAVMKALPNVPGIIRVEGVKQKHNGTHANGLDYDIIFEFDHTHKMPIKDFIKQIETATGIHDLTLYIIYDKP